MAVVGGVVTSAEAEEVAVKEAAATEQYRPVLRICTPYGKQHVYDSICHHVSGDGILCDNDLHGSIHSHGYTSVCGIQRQMLKRCKVSGWL